MDFQTFSIISTGICLLVWIYLIGFNGRFWRADEVLGETLPEAGFVPPAVVAVIPARNEAENIAAAVESHLASSYPGPFTVIVVDDQSEDGTGDIVRKLGRDGARAVHAVAGKPLPEGWSGKLWAVHNGLEAARTLAPEAAYVLLTDADIVHAPATLTKLVGKAEHEKRALVSVMAHLDARGFWGSLLVPAFIFFFQKLYPFPLVNDTKSATAGAAGGCMLIDRRALDAIGGVAGIRGSLIDDCGLAAALKDPKGARRPVWLGFDAGVVSLRDNRRLATIWKMVARTAFTQLRFSGVLLFGATIGMALTYLAAPFAFVALPLHGSALAFLFATASFLLAMIAYLPTLRRYGKSPFWALLLPLAASFYMLMTISSALDRWRGRGGAWKGRTYS